MATMGAWRRQPWGRGVVSVHLYTSATAMGALNLYTTQQRSYAAEDLELARLVGAHASIVLARYRSDANLWTAIESRHRIGQAQGILMERYKISAEQALAVLRRLSGRHNIKLHMVADHIVVTGRLPESSSTNRSPSKTQNEAVGTIQDAVAGGESG